MARQIIILETQSVKPKILGVRYLLWLTTNSPIPKPSFNSQYTGVTAGETSALQAGTTVEESYSQDFPDTMSTTEMKLFLARHLSSRQSYYASTVQPGSYYGISFDGTTWSA